MATPRRPRRPIGPTPPGEGEESLAAPAQGLGLEELSDDAATLLGMLGADASRVTISRERDDKPGEFSFVTQMAADEFTDAGMTYLRDEWGGGRYKITVTDARHGPLNAFFVSIDPRFKGRMNPAAPSPNGNGNGNGHGESQSFERDLLKLLIVDRMRTQTQPQQAARGGLDDTDKLLRLAEVLKPADNSAGMAAMMGAFKSMFELTREIEAPSASDPLAAAITAIGPVVKDAIATRAASSVTAVQPAQAPIVANPDGSIARIEAPTVVIRQPLDGIATVLVHAADNTDQVDPDGQAAMYADMVIDQLQNDDETFGGLVMLRQSGSFRLETVMQIIPQLSQTPARMAFAERLTRKMIEAIDDVLREESEATTP